MVFGMGQEIRHIPSHLSTCPGCGVVRGQIHLTDCPVLQPQCGIGIDAKPEDE